MATKLLCRYMHFPEGTRLREVVDGFEACWVFPQVAGAIDGTHIPIISPQDNPSDYYNRKGFHSIIMQAVVDFRGLFLDTYIGWPGKVHDARVFSNSAVYQKGREGTLLPAWKRRINRVEVCHLIMHRALVLLFQIPLLILGDPAYPLLPWLMKPYTVTSNITSTQKQFNYRQSRARMAVENAFGRLKGRWRCLLKRMDFALENVPNVVAACVILHNLCEMYGDHFQFDWELNKRCEVETDASRETSGSQTASDIRNPLAQ